MREEVVKLFDSELKVMDVLWKEGVVPARHVADVLTRELGWNKNTTYTLIKRCINKGAIQRTEPDFMCRPLIARETVQEAETNELINKIFDGSANKLFASLLGRKKLSAEEIENLKKIVGDLD
ncbi:MAG: BlaI/MecI/CopY family transcriptional regulator [Blautia sp.]|nr:BlaI/MecI/CopY family transcriptional regulator [Blautia sp.]